MNVSITFPLEATVHCTMDPAEFAMIRASAGKQMVLLGARVVIKSAEVEFRVRGNLRMGNQPNVIAEGEVHVTYVDSEQRAKLKFN